MTLKQTARMKVNQALLKGKLRRKPCEVCGVKKTDAHHDDYTKPLRVVWLCRTHHSLRHTLGITRTGMILRFRIDRRLLRRMERVAGKECRTLASLIRISVVQYLEGK